MSKKSSDVANGRVEEEKSRGVSRHGLGGGA